MRVCATAWRHSSMPVARQCSVYCCFLFKPIEENTRTFSHLFFFIAIGSEKFQNEKKKKKKNYTEIVGLPGLTTPRIVRALLAPAVQQITELQRWGHCHHMSMLCCVRLYALSRTGLSFHTQCKCLTTCGMIKQRKISLFFFFLFPALLEEKNPNTLFRWFRHRINFAN